MMQFRKAMQLAALTAAAAIVIAATQDVAAKAPIAHPMEYQPGWSPTLAPQTDAFGVSVALITSAGP